MSFGQSPDDACAYSRHCRVGKGRGEPFGYLATQGQNDQKSQEMEE